MQKYLRISTWPEPIPIYKMPPLEKDKESEYAGCLVFFHTFSGKNKEDYIFIATSFLSKQRNKSVSQEYHM